MNLSPFYQGLDTSFFLAPSGQRFTSISLAQNFATTMQQKEKLAKVILEDKAKDILEDKDKPLQAKAILEDNDKPFAAKGILEAKSLTMHKMNTRTGKRKGAEGVDLEPEAKKQKLDMEPPASLQLSKEVILRR